MKSNCIQNENSSKQNNVIPLISILENDYHYHLRYDLRIYQPKSGNTYVEVTWN